MMNLRRLITSIAIGSILIGSTFLEKSEASKRKDCNCLSKLCGEANGSKEIDSVCVVFNDQVHKKK